MKAANGKHHSHLHHADDKHGKRRSQTIRSGVIMSVASFCVLLSIGLVVWWTSYRGRHFGAKMDTDVRHFANIKHPIKNTANIKNIVMRREENRLRGAAAAKRKQQDGIGRGGMDKLGRGGTERESVHTRHRAADDRAHAAAAAPGSNGLDTADQKVDINAIHAARRRDPLARKAGHGALDEQIKMQRDSLSRGQQPDAPVR